MWWFITDCMIRNHGAGAAIRSSPDDLMWWLWRVRGDSFASWNPPRFDQGMPAFWRNDIWRYVPFPGGKYIICDHVEGEWDDESPRMMLRLTITRGSWVESSLLELSVFFRNLLRRFLKISQNALRSGIFMKCLRISPLLDSWVNIELISIRFRSVISTANHSVLSMWWGGVTILAGLFEFLSKIFSKVYCSLYNARTLSSHATDTLADTIGKLDTDLISERDAIPLQYRDLREEHSHIDGPCCVISIINIACIQYIDLPSPLH